MRYNRHDGDDFTIIPIWVDNLVSFANNASVNTKVKRKLKTKFEINVIGEPSMLLGMNVTRNYNKSTITLSQSHYIDVMLSKFGMNNADPVSTLLDPNVKLDQTHRFLTLYNNMHSHSCCSLTFVDF